jgi:chromosome segregation ATPase
MRAFTLFAILAAETYGSSPVSKVVELLKAMQNDLDAEETADKAAQDKMECWCKDTKKDASADIDESTSTIASKTAEISEQTGKSAEAAAKAKDAEAKVASLRKELDEMTALRGQEQTKFQETEKELVQSIGALESAITVLSKHNSFMQTGSTNDIHKVAAVLNAQLSRYQSRHIGEITPSQRSALEQFIQQPSYAAYQSQSGEIFGILGNMKDEFTSDLDEERKMEAEAVATYSKGKKIKEETIKAQETSYKTQSTKAANAKAATAEAEAAKASSEESLTKATALLDETTATCATSVSDFEARGKVRAEEIEAVAKALEFLNSDEAHALFNRTFDFLQIGTANAKKFNMIRSKLTNAGFNFRNKDMFVLAQAIKAGAFDKVIKAIDDLVKEIDATIKSDATRKDECTSTINKKKSDLAALNNAIEKEEAKKARLESKKSNLEQEIATLEEEIGATQKDQKELSQAREQQNKEYQTTVADQNASIQVLNQALTVLKNVYGTKSFIQQPAQFQDSGKSSGGNKVLQMIESIIADSEQAKALAIQDENNAQKSYEASMQDMNDLINSKTSEKDEKTGELGRTGTELSTTEATLTTNYDEKKSQDLGLAATEEECKFLFDNFDIRLEHMNGEKAALAEAKAFLQGMTA